MLHGRLCQDERVDEASASPVGYRLFVAALDCLGRPEAPPAVVLEPAQQQWLDTHRSLRVGLVLQAPYAQFDRRLAATVRGQRRAGEQLAQALRLDLTWRNFSDQASLEHALQSGEIDFAPGLTQTPASLRLWLVQRPIHARAATGGGPRTGAMAVELEKLEAEHRGGAHAQPAGGLPARQLRQPQPAGRAQRA
jgi:hypothetical protein